MKITRGSYPMLFGLIIFLLLRQIIKEFSESFEEQLRLPLFLVGIILIVIGLIFAIKDKELFVIISDERTKWVDKNAVYYSWWICIISLFFIGIISSILNFSIILFMYIIFTEMFITMTLLHMYFNLWGNF